MTDIRVKLLFVETLLGTSPSDENVLDTYIASKAPDAATRAEEVEALGVEEVVEKGTTMFPRLKDGTPFIWDYQMRGYAKEKCGFMRNIPGTFSSKVKAYKKKVDGTIFVLERKIPIITESDIEICQRPLRAQTAQGDRVAIASSEEISRRSTCTMTFRCMIDSDIDLIREWLDYGKYHGTGQWRNSGHGKFLWMELDADGNPIERKVDKKSGYVKQGGNFTPELFEEMLAAAEA